MPLGLIPQTWTEAGVLWVGMLTARLIEAWIQATYGWMVRPTATVIVWCVYLPTLVMILRRPNLMSNPRHAAE